MRRSCLCFAWILLTVNWSAGWFCGSEGPLAGWLCCSCPSPREAIEAKRFLVTRVAHAPQTRPAAKETSTQSLKRQFTLCQVRCNDFGLKEAQKTLAFP